MLKVFLAIKLATKNESGVITTTASVILALIVIMNISVPSIVMTPVKNCVNPISRPSANWSTSALDFATDAALRKAIRGMNNSPTVFIVSQRAASLMYADLIIVLDDGQVAGMGTHDELLANCEVYKEIYESQFKKADSEGGVA